MSEAQKQIAESILSYYGFSNQKQKTIEELSELIVALSRNLQRSWDFNLQQDVIEEIADVKIMIAQMEIIFGADSINKVINDKLERQQQRITNGE